MASIASTIRRAQARRGSGSPSLRDRYRGALSSAGQTSSDVQSDYLERAQGFDPYEAVRRSSQAAFADISDQFGEDLESFRGAQVGSGRIDTGFRFQDEDRLYRDVMDRLNRRIAEQSLGAAGLNLQNIQGLGQFGSGMRRDYFDLISGGLDREQAERNARRQQRGSMLGAIGSIGGALLGGPVGGALGGALGGLFGGGKKGG